MKVANEEKCKMLYGIEFDKDESKIANKHE